MNKKTFVPKIKGFYFKNFNQVEASDFNKKFSGDIYYNTEYIGEYNQWYREDNGLPKVFIKLTDYGKEITESYKYYASIFEIPITETDAEEASQALGFDILLEDLAIVTYLYGHMNNVCPDLDFSEEHWVGIITKGLPYFIQLRDGKERTKNEVIQFIREKIPQIPLDDDYNILIFLSRQDFDI